jgi:hypothetical protein
MKTSEKIAARFNNDGDLWEEYPSGLTFNEVIDLYPHITEYSGDPQFCSTIRKYTFRDGSILTEFPCFWDFGRSECFCGKEEHDPNCPQISAE